MGVVQAALAPPILRDLNAQAAQSARLSLQRGLTLMVAVTGALTRYSSGTYGLGPRHVSFLRFHLDGVEATLKHRIDDDGGETWRTIISTLKRAERAFSAEQTVQARSATATDKEPERGVRRVRMHQVDTA